MIQVILLIICVGASSTNYANAQVQVCKYTPVDGGDPESVQLAQLDAIKCLIETNQMQFKDGTDAIRSMHNDSVKIQTMILNALQKQQASNTFGTIIGYFILSILISISFHQLCKIIWYYMVQKLDRIANLVLAYYHLKALVNSASPSFNTLEELRQAQPVPILLVIIYCCRCKHSSIDV